MDTASKRGKKRGLLWRDAFFNTLLSFFTCFLLSLIFVNISFFDPIKKALRDFSFLDVYYAENLGSENRIGSNLILINIEDRGRGEIAFLLQEVLKGDPKVIGFDAILKEFEATKADTLLADLLTNEKIIASYVLNKEGNNIVSHPFFSGSRKLGYANFNFDSNSTVVREFNGAINLEGKAFSSFSRQIAKEFLGSPLWERNVYDKKLTSSQVIKYRYGENQLLSFGFDEFVNLKSKAVVRDKIVLLGYLGTPTGNIFDIEDKHFTPLNKVTSGKSVPDMFGLVIHANIIAMILANDFMFKVSNFWLLVITFIFSFLASAYFIWLDRRLDISYRTVRKLVSLAFSILLVGITLWLFKNGVVLKSTPLIAVTIFTAGFVKYYKHLVRYLNRKTKFRSYL